MKTLKYITIAFRFFKSSILKTNKTEKNTENLKFAKNTALSQMYAEENETLFI